MPTKKEREKRDSAEYTVFQKDARLNGRLKFKKPLQIRGSFYGEIEGDNILHLSDSSVSEASLNIRTLILEGKLTGNVVASERVELRRGSILIGDIRTPKLEISEGVTFDGQCDMTNNS